MRLLRVFVLLLLGSLVVGAVTVGAPVDAGRQLPITLRVLEFDAKLNAYLLAGEFSNDLPQALRAWRGTLRLSDGEREAAFFLEQQSKRPILPGYSGVWNVWIKHQENSPDHHALQQFKSAQVEISLRLLQVLYVDGAQQRFE